MTNPGQTTPWAKIPVPSEGKIPDVPVDLAAVADAVDTILKNVIGGSAAPTGPLSPSVIDASASIGSLNATQTTQQSQITTMQGQITALSATPWAVATARTTTFTMPGTTKTPLLALSYQLPTWTQRRLLIAFGTISVGWSGTYTTALRSRLQLMAHGTTTYVDRNINVQNGNDQCHNVFCIETVEAGLSPRVGLAMDVFGATNSGSVTSQALDPRLYLIGLPWSGSTVPYLPIT